MNFADQQALARLESEMSKIGKSSRGKVLGEYQVIEQAAARLGMFPSYAFRLRLRSKVSQTSTSRPL